ncbi:MAG TPA: amidohydrolase family protein [Mycobacteriales bacterium]|nr:amidohydrolase family protein [Mycobacteriales bacterium]
MGVLTGAGIQDAVDQVELVDHHCHGVVTGELEDDEVEALLSEGGPPAPGLTNFDTPLGLAVRRHCAPVLDLPEHPSRRDYLDRRRELGPAELTRRFLVPTGTSRFCVDTGFRPDGLTTPEELAAAAGARGHHVVRLESVAEALAADGVEPDEFGPRFADRLARTTAVGVKSVAAYRVGLDLDPVPPTPAEVTAAAREWLGGSSRARLDHPVLIRATLAAAVELGRPIQFHIGLGDPDIRMWRVDPTLLTDWLHRHRVPVMLLHCWPYQRQASYLAAVHPHVHLDVGLALHFVGPTRAAAVLAEAAELAPYGKLLYSSDAFGLPELYFLGALTFRRALGSLLTERTAAGEWSVPDAYRIAAMVAHENATRVYELK